MEIIALMLTAMIAQQTWIVLCKVNKQSDIDPMQKWPPLNCSFVHIQNSLTNLVFERKILKNLLPRARLVKLF